MVKGVISNKFHVEHYSGLGPFQKDGDSHRLAALLFDLGKLLSKDFSTGIGGGYGFVVSSL